MKFVIRGTRINKKGKERYLYLQELEAGADKYTMGPLKTAMLFPSVYLANIFATDYLSKGYISGRPYYKVIEIWSMEDSEYNRLCGMPG